jgi:hypothetical protein
MIWVVHPGSRGQKGPGSGSATLKFYSNFRLAPSPHLRSVPAPPPPPRGRAGLCTTMKIFRIRIQILCIRNIFCPLEPPP